MALKKWSFLVPAASGGERLDHFLYESLKTASRSLKAEDAAFGASRAFVRKWILSGNVEVNRRKLSLPSRALRSGESVELFLDEAARKKADDRSKERAFTLANVPVIFEDEDLLVVAKPPGLPTQPTLDPTRPNLFDLLKNRPGTDYVGLHHRLDRDTSGVVLFTKRKEANAGVADAFKGRTAKKTYLALVEKRSGWRRAEHWVVENFLKKDERKSARKEKRMRSVRSGGDAAKTTFDVLEIATPSTIALVACQPHTGRMHQIRVHLSEGGAPIVGDEMYGSPRAGRVMLHAAELRIPHPRTGKEMRFRASPPPDFLESLRSFGLDLPVEYKEGTDAS